MESLEAQLSTLEARVYGQEGVTKGYKACVDRLAYFNSRLNSAITGRDKITNMLKRLEDVEKLLDPEYLERLTTPDSAKLQLIAFEEEKVRQTVALLEKLEELKPVLNSEHIKNTPNLSGELVRLNQIHVQQEEEVNKLDSNVLPLIDSYNEIIQTLTKQFIQWDNLITTLEMKSSK